VFCANSIVGIICRTDASRSSFIGPKADIRRWAACSYRAEAEDLTPITPPPVDRFRHKCEVPRCPLYRRYWVISGSDTGTVKPTRLTQCRLFP